MFCPYGPKHGKFYLNPHAANRTIIHKSPGGLMMHTNRRSMRFGALLSRFLCKGSTKTLGGAVVVQGLS